MPSGFWCWSDIRIATWALFRSIAAAGLTAQSCRMMWPPMGSRMPGLIAPCRGRCRDAAGHEKRVWRPPPHYGIRYIRTTSCRRSARHRGRHARNSMFLLLLSAGAMAGCQRKTLDLSPRISMMSIAKSLYRASLTPVPPGIFGATAAGIRRDIEGRLP